MLLPILYALIGLLTAGVVAYHYHPGPYDEMPASAVALFAGVVWPLTFFFRGATAINRAGKRAKERKEIERQERIRLLQAAEAQLNRDGFYGEVVKQKQLAHDQWGSGLYTHALTAAME